MHKHKLFEDFSDSETKNQTRDHNLNDRRHFLETPNSMKWFLVIISLLAIACILITLLSPKQNVGRIIGAPIGIVIVIIQLYIAFNINELIQKKSKWIIAFFWIKFGLVTAGLLPALFVLFFVNSQIFVVLGGALLIDLAITLIIVKNFKRFFSQSTPK